MFVRVESIDMLVSVRAESMLNAGVFVRVLILPISVRAESILILGVEFILMLVSLLKNRSAIGNVNATCGNDGTGGITSGSGAFDSTLFLDLLRRKNPFFFEEASEMFPPSDSSPGVARPLDEDFVLDLEGETLDFLRPVDVAETYPASDS